MIYLLVERGSGDVGKDSVVERDVAVGRAVVGNPARIME